MVSLRRNDDRLHPFVGCGKENMSKRWKMRVFLIAAFVATTFWGWKTGDWWLWFASGATWVMAMRS